MIFSVTASETYPAYQSVVATSLNEVTCEVGVFPAAFKAIFRNSARVRFHSGL